MVIIYTKLDCTRRKNRNEINKILFLKRRKWSFTWPLNLATREVRVNNFPDATVHGEQHAGFILSDPSVSSCRIEAVISGQVGVETRICRNYCISDSDRAHENSTGWIMRKRRTKCRLLRKRARLWFIKFTVRLIRKIKQSRTSFRVNFILL